MKTQTTFIALVAALAVTSGGLGLSLTGVFEQNDITVSSNTANGLMMGHLTIEAHDESGELIAYRQSDNEVVDDGEQCSLSLLFQDNGASAQVLGTGTSSCAGQLNGAWDTIAIGTGSTGAADSQVLLVNETSTSHGLQRADATTKTWTNGTGATTTKIVMSKTFTNDSPRDIFRRTVDQSIFKDYVPTEGATLINPWSSMFKKELDVRLFRTF